MVYFFTSDWTMEDLTGKNIQPVDELLTTRQLQDLLQVNRVTIYRMLKEGRLEGFKVGGQWRFSRHMIQQWLGEKRAVRDSRTSPEIPGRAAELQLPSSSCVQAIQDIFAEALGVGAVITAQTNFQGRKPSEIFDPRASGASATDSRNARGL